MSPASHLLDGRQKRDYNAHPSAVCLRRGYLTELLNTKEGRRVVIKREPTQLYKYIHVWSLQSSPTAHEEFVCDGRRNAEQATALFAVCPSLK